MKKIITKKDVYGHNTYKNIYYKPHTYLKCYKKLIFYISEKIDF